MKTNKNRTTNIIRVIATITLLLTATFIYAQPGGPGGIGGGTGGGGNPPAVPIDGGVVMLVVGAALYGRKRMTQNQMAEAN